MALCKKPCESLGVGQQMARTPRGWDPSNGALMGHWPETGWVTPPCAGATGPVGRSSIRSRSAAGPCPHPMRPPASLQGDLGQDIPSRQGDTSPGARVSHLSQGSCLVSASLALPRQINSTHLGFTWKQSFTASEISHGARQLKSNNTNDTS